MPTQPDGAFHIGEKPKLADLIRQAMRTNQMSLHTQTPGTVVTFQPGPPVPTAMINIDHLRSVLDPTGSIGIPKAIPPIASVPVEFPRGGGWRISWVLLPGTTGTLWFTERSIDTWRELGGPINPKSGRLHALRDCFFRPGIHPKTNPALGPAGGVGAGFIIEKEDGTASIAIDAAGGITLTTGTLVKLGSAAAIQSAVLGELFLAIFNSHTHVYLPGPGAAVPTAPPVPVMTTAQLSAKVKVDP